MKKMATHQKVKLGMVFTTLLPVLASMVLMYAVKTPDAFFIGVVLLLISFICLLAFSIFSSFYTTKMEKQEREKHEKSKDILNYFDQSQDDTDLR